MVGTPHAKKIVMHNPYYVELASDDASGAVRCTPIGDFPTFDAATAAAKAAAGKEARFHQCGKDSYITGPLGTAWITRNKNRAVLA